MERVGVICSSGPASFIDLSEIYKKRQPEAAEKTMNQDIK